MKVIGINGSPLRNGNTSLIIREVGEGIEDMRAAGENTARLLKKLKA